MNAASIVSEHVSTARRYLSEPVPPKQHPAFQYEGFTPGKNVLLPMSHVLRPGYGAFKLDVVMEVCTQVPLRDSKYLYTDIWNHI